MNSRCQQTDGTAHSSDLVEVWHGTAVPALLCGKHAQSPDWSKATR